MLKINRSVALNDHDLLDEGDLDDVLSLQPEKLDLESLNNY